MEGALALCTASRLVRSLFVCLRVRARAAPLTRELDRVFSSTESSSDLTESLARSLVHSRSVLIVLMSDPVGHDSSVREVLAEVAEFSRQLVHHLLEDHRVDVLPWNCREREAAISDW